MVLYATPRLLKKMWDNFDYARILIPPLAFLAWTMLQRATAFDALAPELPEVPRSVIAVFIAIVLSILTTALAYKADQKTTTGGTR